MQTREPKSLYPLYKHPAAENIQIDQRPLLKDSQQGYSSSYRRRHDMLSVQFWDQRALSSNPSSELSQKTLIDVKCLIFISSMDVIKPNRQEYIENEIMLYKVDTQLVVIVMRLPWWLRWLRIYLKCRRPGFDPWVGKIPWSGKCILATPVFLPGKSHGQRSLAGYSPWGCKESDTIE